MKVTKENIWLKSYKGDIEILKSPLVDTYMDESYNNSTPLHELALLGKIEVLEHPSVATVKNISGWTPLHALAYRCRKKEDIIKILNYRDLDKIKDNYGTTPLHILAERGVISREWLKEKYPWFQLGDEYIERETINYILNAQNSEKFIESIC